MNYEEKVINGILHRRCSYTELFKPFTQEELTELLLKERSAKINMSWPTVLPKTNYPWMEPTVTYKYNTTTT